MAKANEKKSKDEKPKTGRPTMYNEELANKICDIISNSNRGLSTICKEEGMPTRSTVHEWVDTNPSFSDKYARAKQDQADFLAEEIISISDDASNDTIINDRGQEVENREWTSRSRLRVDARKWVASKLKPKTWGDKLDLTSGGDKIQTPVIIDWSGKSSEKTDERKD